VDEGLRCGRRYRVSIDADAFAQLLERDEGVTLFAGPPQRKQASQDHHRASAWRVGDTFILTRPTFSPILVDPPALVLRFDEDGTVQAHAQLSLGTKKDYLSQHAGELLRRGALRTGLVGVGFGVGFLTFLVSGIFAAILVLWSSLLSEAVSQVLLVVTPILCAIGAFYSFARVAFGPVVNHEQLAWKLGLPRLTQLTGQLLTPHILGSAETGPALPYRVGQPSESAG
jgi:hypothetical protein